MAKHYSYNPFKVRCKSCGDMLVELGPFDSEKWCSCHLIGVLWQQLSPPTFLGDTSMMEKISFPEIFVIIKEEDIPKERVQMSLFPDYIKEKSIPRPISVGKKPLL